ncbi:hypothetical protein QJQ45_007595 [Haematococcus lacustris]|nr:hypothetical protein QJQ45_007595 [Haematococcus lacustris]
MRAKHKLGLANQDSIYYQMSQDIARVAAKGSCERVMLDPGIPTAAQRTALLYRTGGLYNQKLAMRWGKAADDRCPLCGEADSATHLLSGCTRIAALIQERHNGAGRLITKAINSKSHLSSQAQALQQSSPSGNYDILEAFFYGRALAITLSRRLSEVVVEVVSEISKAAAERPQRVREFQV